jgi:hypothetical protein
MVISRAGVTLSPLFKMISVVELLFLSVLQRKLALCKQTPKKAFLTKHLVNR